MLRVVKWFLISIAVVLMTACGGGGAADTTQQDAINLIEAYADSNGTGTAPTAEAYADAGVDLNGTSVDDVNAYILLLDEEDADTEDEIQDIVDNLATLVVDTDGDGIPNGIDLDDDNDGTSDEDELANGTDPLVNATPTGNAGVDQSANTYTTVTLDGSGSNDVDSPTITYLWHIVTKPVGSIAMLDNSTVLAPTMVIDKAGTYTISLVVNDGNSDSVVDTMEITALDTMVVAFVDGEHEYEPWITNGTEAGTMLLKDINTKAAGSDYRDFTQVETDIYFIENFAMFSALWKTDGTDSGTVLVKNLPVGAKDLMEAGGSLYFVIKDSSNTGKTELWTSDGTEDGTKAIKVIESDNRPEINGMASMGGELYFLLTDYLHDIELWKSNGTEASTTLVKDIWSGNDAGGAYGNSLTAINGKLYFTGYTDTSGREPWISDGTGPGTDILKDIYGGADSSYPGSFVELDGNAYFIAYDDHRSEVWTTDGTDGGTKVYGTEDVRPSSLVWFDGKLHYSNDNDRKIYETDGTIFRTIAVTDALSRTPRDLLVIGSLLYFTVANTELWVTDGTFEGEIKLSDSIRRSSMTALGGKLYFSSTDVTSGTELWESNGTVLGTKLLKDINDGNSSSNPESMTNIGGALYFTADDSVHGNEVWKSNGTEGGTSILKDIVKSTLSSTFLGHANPIQVEGSHYFIASDNGMGLNQFWKSNGTVDGTTMLKVLGGTQDTYSTPTDLNGTMYFSSYSFILPDRSIWISDGTETNTKKLIDISGESFTRANGINYFVADGTQLWETNGTVAGTSEIRAGIEMCSNERTKLVSFNDKVYFAGDDGTGAGCELYESNGTVAGTKIVGDLKPGGGNSEPKQFTVVGDKLYFVTTDGIDHILWMSDGTTGNATKVKTIPIHHIYALTKSNDKLYFSSNDELWITDGTITTMIKDINPGVYTHMLHGHTAVDNKLYFTADDGTHGRELWVSDGTVDGTKMVSEIQDDNYADYPVIYGGLNGKVVFHTMDSSLAKMWVSDGEATGTTVIAEESVNRYGE